MRSTPVGMATPRPAPFLPPSGILGMRTHMPACFWAVPRKVDDVIKMLRSLYLLKIFSVIIYRDLNVQEDFRKFVGKQWN